jgi:hypothetical protein
MEMCPPVFVGGSHERAAFKECIMRERYACVLAGGRGSGLWSSMRDPVTAEQ